MCSQSYGFTSSHVQMWKLDHKEGWAPKNWCFRIVVLEKTLESLLDSKEIKPVNPKGDQPWIFIIRIDAEAQAPILWAPDVKSWLIGKEPGAGKGWGQEKKGATEDEMVGWHHLLNGHWVWVNSGDSEEQGSLACCSPWGRKESDTTKQLNNNNIVLLSMNSLLMNQQNTLNKVFLSRNTNKTRLCIDQLIKRFWPENYRKLTLYFLREQQFNIHGFYRA